MPLARNLSIYGFGCLVANRNEAPNELFIVSSDAIPKIHASKSGCSKRGTGVYDVVNYKGESNLDSMVHHEDHRWRRQVWERAMTKKGDTWLRAV